MWQTARRYFPENTDGFRTYKGGSSSKNVWVRGTILLSPLLDIIFNCQKTWRPFHHLPNSHCKSLVPPPPFLPHLSQRVTGTAWSFLLTENGPMISDRSVWAYVTTMNAVIHTSYTRSCVCLTCVLAGRFDCVHSVSYFKLNNRTWRKRTTARNFSRNFDLVSHTKPTVIPRSMPGFVAAVVVCAWCAQNWDERWTPRIVLVLQIDNITEHFVQWENRQKT